MSFSALMSGDLAEDRAFRAHLISSSGRQIPLAFHRWLTEPEEEEQGLLDRAVSPVIDIGCGPGRHTLALMGRGLDVLGIDASPASARLAWSRGARVLVRSVFGSVPREGGWGTALLLDGNVGIGGEPKRLLERTRELLRAGGSALLEIEPPGEPTLTLLVRLDAGGRITKPFPWAQVGADDVPALAGAAGFDLAEQWTASGRWFARLVAQ